MKNFAKFLIFFSLLTLTACQFDSSENSGVKLRAVGCDLEIPVGYVISSTNNGSIRGSITGPNQTSLSFFEYSQNQSWSEVSAKLNWEVKVLSSEELGELSHLQVEYTPLGVSGPNWTYDVITNESEYFGSPVQPGDFFIGQFEACAKAKITNRSSAFRQQAGSTGRSSAAPLN